MRPEASFETWLWGHGHLPGMRYCFDTQPNPQGTNALPCLQPQHTGRLEIWLGLQAPLMQCLQASPPLASPTLSQHSPRLLTGAARVPPTGGPGQAQGTHLRAVPDTGAVYTAFHGQLAPSSLLSQTQPAGQHPSSGFQCHPAFSLVLTSPKPYAAAPRTPQHTGSSTPALCSSSCNIQRSSEPSRYHVFSPAAPTPGIASQNTHRMPPLLLVPPFPKGLGQTGTELNAPIFLFSPHPDLD